MNQPTTIRVGERALVELLPVAHETVAHGDHIIGYSGTVEAVDTVAVRITDPEPLFDTGPDDPEIGGTRVIPWSVVACVSIGD